MNTENSNFNGSPPPAWEPKIVWLLCLLGGLHVFIYGAAFPFFNNVDESFHFDLALKYAQGSIPRHLEPFSDESVDCIALYGANTYMTPGTNSGECDPPPWKLPAETQEQLIAFEKTLRSVPNTECSQPPLYYMLAGDWWRLARGWGLNGGQRIYGLHFLNIPIVCLLIWLGWYAAKQVFPGNTFPRIAVPALIACLPQSAFYSIENDVLSPLCFGAAFVCLLRFFRAECPNWRLGALAGSALAATFLTKMTNVPLLAVSIVALAWFAGARARKGTLRPTLPALLTLSVCAGLPALGLIGWNLKYFGDPSGSRPKIDFLGWTPKPFLEWFHHPIFTPHGAWTFWSQFVSGFWQGEIIWHKLPLALPTASWFYELATSLLLLVALAGIIRRPAPARQNEYDALRFSFFLFAAVIAFMVYISIRFDFNNCFYPSRAFPYLMSGRLALGALIPLMLLLVSGLDRILCRLTAPTKFIVLAILTLAMLGTEFAANHSVFLDKYNWYHM